MPQDFRSLRPPAQTIGFHELRQACEISSLREDLERVLHETGELRDQIEDSVERVRSRFAALTPEQLADSGTMAPLLQFAVSQLIALRDHARTLSVQTGAVPDEERPSWSVARSTSRASGPGPATSPPPPAATAQQSVPPAADDEVEPASPSPPPPPAPTPTAVRATTPIPTEPPSWLAPPGLRAPARPAPAAGRDTPRPGAIDWLQPARR